MTIYDAPEIKEKQEKAQAAQPKQQQVGPKKTNSVQQQPTEQRIFFKFFIKIFIKLILYFKNLQNYSPAAIWEGDFLPKGDFHDVADDR